MTTLYGIRNCDTMRKARRWLDTHDVDYVFHDVRSDGLDRARKACGRLAQFSARSRVTS